MGQNLVSEKGEAIILDTTCRPDLIHILMKLHENIPKVTELWRVQEGLKKNQIHFNKLHKDIPDGN